LLVENVYNDAPNPQFVDEIYVSIGLSNQAFALNQGVFTCSFTRTIQNEQYANKFFDLNKLYYAFLAKGPLNAASKLVIFFNLHMCLRIIYPKLNSEYLDFSVKQLYFFVFHKAFL
jgi:hypothetical protein